MNRQRRWFAVAGVVLVLCVAGAMRLTTQPTARSLTAAAGEFLAALSPQERAQATLPFDSAARTDWHFIPKDNRKGLQIKNMDARQRKLALSLLQQGLSEAGYGKATAIMALDSLLLELEKGSTGKPLRDPERYYFTLFGDVRDEARWGLSIEGHHLSLNFVVDNGKVSSTPAFFGTNPALIMGDYGIGPKKGTRVLGQEEQLGFDLLHALTDEQRKLALIAEKAPADITGPVGPQATRLEPAGLTAARLQPEQLKILRALIEVHARNMAPELSAVRLDEIDSAGIERVSFAWAGADKPGIGHYFRVHGPTFLVELVNVQPDAAGNPANHVHTVWRNLGGDFGLER